jgi:hypothetical protein
MRESKRHLRTRDVPHPHRKRKFGKEDSGRRIEGGSGSWPATKIAGKNLATHEAKPPAIGFLYDDLAEQVSRVPRKVFGQYPKGFV